ncbi:MAG TPA: preprotein translocase subunit SecY [Firmicutes bacterium]|nr:preprotein translocase subunit SecY [Bacillota bacterium]
MLATLKNAFKVEEIRGKIFFTLFMFLIFRIGAHIPAPGVNPDVVAELLSQNIFGFIDVLSGGAFKNISIFAMGIMPYINASIIMNLLTIVVPYFERLAKEGPEGKRKMAQITRYGCIILGFVQALLMSFYLRNAMYDFNFFSVMIVTISLTAGTAILMWMGEMITEKGIGNGISLIIFAGIVSRIPSGITYIVNSLRSGEVNFFAVLLFLVIALVIIIGIIYINEGQRRIPVQYAKRVVGRKVYGGQSTNIPMKVNQAGVIPIIFAMSILMLPGLIASFFDGAVANAIARWFSTSHPVYMVVDTLLIIFFAYFYTAVTFSPVDVADNMKKNGGFIPGIRPGRPTAEYLDRILTRLTLAGAIFLAFIALLPNLMTAITGVNVSFGGTSLLIAVGVALDTMKQLESQLLMRNYQGFMK